MRVGFRISQLFQLFLLLWARAEAEDSQQPLSAGRPKPLLPRHRDPCWRQSNGDRRALLLRVPIAFHPQKKQVTDKSKVVNSSSGAQVEPLGTQPLLGLGNRLPRLEAL
jgi:hypothetical protein